MRTLVESLKRLYAKKNVTQEKLADMVKKKTITQEEYQYITAEEAESLPCVARINQAAQIRAKIGTD